MSTQHNQYNAFITNPANEIINVLYPRIFGHNAIPTFINEEDRLQFAFSLVTIFEQMNPNSHVEITFNVEVKEGREVQVLSFSDSTVSYKVTLDESGDAVDCTCPHHTNRGVACKHMDYAERFL